MIIKNCNFLYLATLMDKCEPSDVVCAQKLTNISNHFQRECLKLTPDFKKYLFFHIFNINYIPNSF